MNVYFGECSLCKEYHRVSRPTEDVKVVDDKEFLHKLNLLQDCGIATYKLIDEYFPPMPQKHWDCLKK